LFQNTMLCQFVPFAAAIAKSVSPRATVTSTKPPEGDGSGPSDPIGDVVGAGPIVPVGEGESVGVGEPLGVVAPVGVTAGAV
jgi:hypothetical protein